MPRNGILIPSEIIVVLGANDNLIDGKHKVRHETAHSFRNMSS